MSSLLDQFNSQSTQRQPEPYPVMADTVKSSGYISMNQDVAKHPIFKKQKMNMQLPHNITHMSIRSGNLVLIMANNVLLRMDLNDVDRSDEIAMDQYIPGLKIENIFLDTTGAHLLISLTPKSTQFCPELIYLHKSQKRPKKMDKLRDHEVTAVAFNYENTSEASTGPILLGTSKGLIFESEFAVEAERPVQNNWRQVFDIGRNNRVAITGLEYVRVPASNKYIVLVSTPDRLYKFQETIRSDDRSPFQAIFRTYTMAPTDLLESSSERFRASSATTQLMRLCYDYSNHFARSFAVLTATDLHLGEMDPWADALANVVDTRQVPFPEYDTEDGQKSREVSPVAFTLTDFHAVLVYPDRIVAISLLDYSVVYEEYFSDLRFGSLLNVTRDAKTGSVYVYSTRAILLLKVTDERRHVWKIYMDLGNLEHALQYAGDNPRHKDIVLSRTAEMKFNSGLYVEAANYYAETMTSFETVCLKFLELRENNALRVFLRRKLFSLHAEDNTQITMLIVWLMELYLAELSRPQQGVAAAATGIDSPSLRQEFDEFMACDRVAQWTQKNSKVVYQLLGSHGGDCGSLLVTLPAANNDFQEAVNQFIHQQKWQEALKVLRAQRKPELFYRFAPILMEAVPKETVAVLMEQRDSLEANKLLPTLICVESAAHVKEVVQYLEFSIHSLGSTEQALHNYLIRLFAEHSRDKLMPYLETQGKDVTQLHYDKQYALRVSKQWKCWDACVFLQCLLGLWTDAVELALQFDVRLAQEKANLPNDVEMRRQLWLRIAKHEIEGKRDDVEGALQLLKSCDLLRIEDILPYFEDFQKIDHFKGAICEALQEYNQRIQEQKKDMEEAARSAERVRKDLQTFRERALTIEANDLCGSCAEYVLKRPCFVFPCGHKFHMDCLERDWLQQSKEGGRLSILKQRMTVAEGTSEFQRHRAAYEDLIASECLFCGHLMIDAIDQPFVDDWERVATEWA